MAPKIELDPVVLADLREYYTGQADALTKIGEYLRQHTVLPEGGYGYLLQIVESIANPIMEFVATGVVAGADLVRTREVLLRSAADVTSDAAFADVTIGEPVVTFVEDLAAAGVHLRLTLKTAPGEQGAVASELRGRVRRALEEAGVPLAA